MNHTPEQIRTAGLAALKRELGPAGMIRFLQQFDRGSGDSQLVHHLARIPEQENRVLRVVLNPLASPVRVVTAFFDRKMKGTT